MGVKTRIEEGTKDGVEGTGGSLRNPRGRMSVERVEDRDLVTGVPVVGMK